MSNNSDHNLIVELATIISEQAQVLEAKQLTISYLQKQASDLQIEKDAAENLFQRADEDRTFFERRAENLNQSYQVLLKEKQEMCNEVLQLRRRDPKRIDAAILYMDREGRDIFLGNKPHPTIPGSPKIAIIKHLREITGGWSLLDCKRFAEEFCNVLPTNSLSLDEEKEEGSNGSD